jgi:hypothetical protein
MHGAEAAECRRSVLPLYAPGINDMRMRAADLPEGLPDRMVAGCQALPKDGLRQPFSRGIPMPAFDPRRPRLRSASAS